MNFPLSIITNDPAGLGRALREAFVSELKRIAPQHSVEITIHETKTPRQRDTPYGAVWFEASDDGYPSLCVTEPSPGVDIQGYGDGNCGCAWLNIKFIMAGNALAPGAVHVAIHEWLHTISPLHRVDIDKAALLGFVEGTPVWTRCVDGKREEFNEYVLKKIL